MGRVTYLPILYFSLTEVTYLHKNVILLTPDWGMFWVGLLTYQWITSVWGVLKVMLVTYQVLTKAQFLILAVGGAITVSESKQKLANLFKQRYLFDWVFFYNKVIKMFLTSDFVVKILFFIINFYFFEEKTLNNHWYTLFLPWCPLNLSKPVI